jgi:hypothetical protein
MKHVTTLLLIIAGLGTFTALHAETISPGMIAGRWHPEKYLDSDGREIKDEIPESGFAIFTQEGNVFLGENGEAVSGTYSIEGAVLTITASQDGNKLKYTVSGLSKTEMTWETEENGLFIKLKKSEQVQLTEQILKGRWIHTGKKSGSTYDKSSSEKKSFVFSEKNKVTISSDGRDIICNYKTFGSLIRIESETDKRFNFIILVDGMSGGDMFVTTGGESCRYSREEVKPSESK